MLTGPLEATMSEDDDPVAQTPKDDEKKPRAREQVPAHVPPQLREMFTKHPGSIAARPGFRNPPNAKSKAQKPGAPKKK
jgi:hypothetical protein